MAISAPLNDTDVNMVNMFRYGDKDEYSKLYTKYAPAVLGVLIRTLGDQKLAEECMHEVFCRIWTERANYNPEKERLFTWIIKIVKNCIAGLSEDKKTMFADDVREEIDLVYAMDIKSYLHKQRQEQGDDFATGADVTIREAIHLIYFESYSFGGAAAKLGISVDVLREKMIKTIKLLKGSLLA
jgi:RNA polymerase sigma factor (sigma-70 family)